MPHETQDSSRVVPAKLSFLAIYNPSLSTSDENFRDQIVFYYNKSAKSRKKHVSKLERGHQAVQEEENEKLRHIGLAQGMVDFARSFSNGRPVESVDTEKSRIVMNELETDWWVLASIDLTRLPIAPTTASKSSPANASKHNKAVEFSSREVSPASLLRRQLLSANDIFRLHHGPSLSLLYERLGRDRFCNTLERFWAKFGESWDVLLHGNPAVDVYGGLKLAAGGELGVGVGEEEWGSGEREVLEEYARRTDGLVDIVVSRFGECHPNQEADQKSHKVTDKPPNQQQNEPWMGRGAIPGSGDGVVFSGVGAISRSSLRSVSHWVEWIYTFGEHTYGVRESPTSGRARSRRRTANPARSYSSSRPDSKRTSNESSFDGSSRRRYAKAHAPGIPPPIVSAAESSLQKASAAIDASSRSELSESGSKSAIADPEVWMKYLTLGYSSWGSSSNASRGNDPSGNKPSEQHPRAVSPKPSIRNLDSQPDHNREAEFQENLRRQVDRENAGHFIIGLKGDMSVDEEADATPEEDSEWNSRTLLRTIHVQTDVPLSASSSQLTDVDKMISAQYQARAYRRVRLVVYIHRPFIYTFMFQPEAASLTLASFYRSLHTFFSPLHRALRNSTSPSKVAVRLASAAHLSTTAYDPFSTSRPILDLVYDPKTNTVHTSIPNIPEPGTTGMDGYGELHHGWTRMDALNVHSQILAVVTSTEKASYEFERTCKTSKGWWVVWMRLPASSPPASALDETEADATAPGKDLREAFLIRRAKDTLDGIGGKTGGSGAAAGLWRFGIGQSTGEKMGGAAAGWGPKGLAEGIGIDARKYVESLLSLNR